MTHKLQPRKTDNSNTAAKYKKRVRNMKTIAERLKPRTYSRPIAVAICSSLGCNLVRVVLKERGTTVIGRSEFKRGREVTMALSLRLPLNIIRIHARSWSPTSFRK